MYEKPEGDAGWDSAELRALADSLALLAQPGPAAGGADAVDDSELLARLTELERLKAVVTAAQARTTSDFAASQARAALGARTAAKGQGSSSGGGRVR